MIQPSGPARLDAEQSPQGGGEPPVSLSTNSGGACSDQFPRRPSFVNKSHATSRLSASTPRGTNCVLDLACPVPRNLPTPPDPERDGHDQVVGRSNPQARWRRTEARHATLPVLKWNGDGKHVCY